VAKVELNTLAQLNDERFLLLSWRMTKIEEKKEFNRKTVTEIYDY
jgi:hypothetical protein